MPSPFTDRNHILAEIRRTASENGGTALGRVRFSSETGIREYDWTRYWPRWSDAVREAGLEPTNRFSVAIAHDVLFEHLCRLVRELGRFPVIRELRVKAWSDSRFPSPETFRRLGSIRSLAQQLRSFALDRGYADVSELCEPELEEPQQSLSPARSAGTTVGTVYLLKSGRFFKIGHSNAVGRRERELSVQLPERVKLLHAITTDDPSGIESYWHRRFNERRKNGEWFELTRDDVAIFRRRKTM